MISNVVAHQFEVLADCFCGLYPYIDQAIVDAVVLPHALGSGQVGTYFNLLKCYPFAFLLTWERNEYIPFHFQNLCDHRNLRHHAETGLVVDEFRTDYSPRSQRKRVL